MLLILLAINIIILICLTLLGKRAKKTKNKKLFVTVGLLLVLFSFGSYAYYAVIELFTS
ncbi:hypothetical protein [Paenilisteria weihenstephanensis]|uniref:hypothetical protein n=1 Tax=Listeria weihenstephanensis TaxID=1006155 RepID=UPI0004AF69C2|nr:hypothetical protein [Listeria weihenstephanensis]